MDRAAKRLAEDMIEIYGPGAVDLSRELIADLLSDKGLNCDAEDIDDFQRYTRWLWEE
jgi:hypothetical protein